MNRMLVRAAPARAFVVCTLANKFQHFTGTIETHFLRAACPLRLSFVQANAPKTRPRPAAGRLGRARGFSLGEPVVDEAYPEPVVDEAYPEPDL